MVESVLVGPMRSGTTLIYCDLLSHGNVYMFGELFNEHEADRQIGFQRGLLNNNAEHKRGIGASQYYQGGNGGNFLTKMVYYYRWWEPTAVGFKLLYHQAQDSDDERAVWKYLIAEKDIRVIHLIREDLLAGLVSLKTAEQTNEWARPKNASPESRRICPESLSLSPEECEQYFEHILERRSWLRQCFSDDRRMELGYETDLCADFQQTMNKIYEFIEVPGKDAEQALEKQAVLTPAARIGNYQELEDYFRHTKYAGLFS